MRDGLLEESSGGAEDGKEGDKREVGTHGESMGDVVLCSVACVGRRLKAKICSLKLLPPDNLTEKYGKWVTPTHTLSSLSLSRLLI